MPSFGDPRIVGVEVDDDGAVRVGKWLAVEGAMIVAIWKAAESFVGIGFIFVGKETEETRMSYFVAA